MMMGCPFCHARETVEQYCSACGSTWREGEDQRVHESWEAIARFSHVAEAGYFADVLESHGIACRVEFRDRVVASDARWRVDYELQVPQGYREEALNVIRRVLHDDAVAAAESSTAEIASDDADADVPWRSTARRGAWWDAEEPPQSAVSWHTVKWLLCALLAGTVGYYAGRHHAAHGHLTPTEQLFWWRVAESAPWVTTTNADGPARTLRYDAARQVLIWEEHTEAGPPVPPGTTTAPRLLEFALR